MLMLFYSLYFVFITELIYCLTLAFFIEEPVIVTLPEGLGACTPTHPPKKIVNFSLN